MHVCVLCTSAYNCGTAGHISKYCYSEAACTKNGCKQKHHLLIHQERRDVSLIHQERRDVSPFKHEPCPSSIEHARNLPTNTKPHSTNFLAASNITVGSKFFSRVCRNRIKACVNLKRGHMYKILIFQRRTGKFFY